jgi:hypothetical protein
MTTRSRGFEEQGATAFVADQKCPEGWVWAYCEAANCGGVAAIDLARWPLPTTAIGNLASLETRMRCICGARQARLSRICPTATSRHVTIYPFS